MTFGGSILSPFERAGAYGMIKQAEILHALPVDLLTEFHRLDRRKRRSPQAQARLEELRNLATQLHRQQRERA